MFLNKTAVFTSLCLSIATAISAQTSNVNARANAGQRIQLDKDGNLLQHSIRNAHDHNVSNGTADSFTTGSAMRAAPAPPAATPAVIRTGAATGVVVRLNGQFRAASRAQIGPDGKLQGDCHISSDAGAGKGDKK